MRRNPSKIFVPPAVRPATFGDWCRDHLLEIFVIAIIAALLLSWKMISSQGRDHETYDVWSAVVTPQKQQELANKYPEGYQLFSIDGWNIAPVGPGTFTEQVDVEWKLSKIASRMPEKLRIHIFKIAIPSLDFSKALEVVLPLKEEHVVSKTAFDHLELTVELVARYENQILCALSYHQIQ